MASALCDKYGENAIATQEKAVWIRKIYKQARSAIPIIHPPSPASLIIAFLFFHHSNALLI
jgi:hypothetical protein